MKRLEKEKQTTNPHKPGGYPFGGHCLPKDPVAFITFLKEQGIDSGFYEEVSRINEEMQRLKK